MSISSALTADEIVFLAWEMLGVVQMGQAPSPIQKKRGRQALNSILKRLPQYGYSFPQLTEGRVVVIIPAGTGKVALPSNFYGSATLMIAEDEIRDSFNRLADASDTGEMDTGGEWTIESGVWGIEDGALTP